MRTSGRRELPFNAVVAARNRESPASSSGRSAAGPWMPTGGTGLMGGWAAAVSKTHKTANRRIAVIVPRRRAPSARGQARTPNLQTLSTPHDVSLLVRRAIVDQSAGTAD